MGRAVARARRVAVVLHGRGQDPVYMLEHLVARLDAPDVAYVLPPAAGGSWYPGRYNEPRAANEPWLGHALEAGEAAIAGVLEAGVPAEQIVLAGFSQGGCLVGGPARADAATVRGRGGADRRADRAGQRRDPAGAARRRAGVHGEQPLRRAGWRSSGWRRRLVRWRRRARASSCEVADDREHRIRAAAVAGVRALLG